MTFDAGAAFVARSEADAGLDPGALDPRALQALRPLLVPALDAARRQRAADARAGRFHAVGEVHALGLTHDWRHNPSADKEWLIEHHKLPVLLDLALCWRESGEAAWLDTWVALCGDWLARMGSGELATSDAQVEAKRLEHWLLALAVLQDGDGLALLPTALLGALRRRLDSEAAHVFANLRPARNHRTFQLFAVVAVAAVLPASATAASRGAAARALLAENLLHDFGDDGVHIELSSHYHQITLETALAFALLMDAVAPAAEVLPEALELRLRQALRFSAWLQLPDGEMPLIGDADLGDHRRLLELGARRHGQPELAWLASGGQRGRAPAERSAWFERAGYFFARDGWRVGADGVCRDQHLFADFGALGEGSHAHYDLFNLTYSVGGRQLLVDPGRYTYHAEADARGIDWRHAFKRSAAHNTVVIDGRDQTRYLSKARQPAAGLARLERGRHTSKHGPAVEPRDRALHLGRRSDWLRATAHSHEYTPRHSRWLVYVQREYLLVLDSVEADDGDLHEAVLGLHLDRAWLDRLTLGVQPAAPLPAWVARGEGWSLHLAASAGESGADAAPALERGWVSRHYGRKEAAPVLRLARRFRRRAVFVTAIGPARTDWAIDALQLRLEDDPAGARLRVAVAGHDARGRWADRSQLALHGGTLALPADAAARGAARFWHERRRGGALDHLLVAGAEGLDLPADLDATISDDGSIEC